MLNKILILLILLINNSYAKESILDNLTLANIKKILHLDKAPDWTMEIDSDFTAVGNARFNETNKLTQIFVAKAKAQQSLVAIFDFKLSKVIFKLKKQLPEFYVQSLKNIQKDILDFISHKYIIEINQDAYYEDKEARTMYVLISLSFFDKFTLSSNIFDIILDVSKQDPSLRSFFIRNDKYLDILEEELDSVF